MNTPEHQLELSALKRDWIEEAAAEVARLVAAGKLPEGESSVGWNSDDLHKLLVIQPKEVNWWGCLMAKLKNEGKIVRTGSKPSTRESRNGAWIGAYKWRQVAPVGSRF